MKPTEQFSTYIAAKACACAEAFLRGAGDQAALAHAADELMRELFVLPGAGDRISDPTRLLVTTMMRTAVAVGETRLERWSEIMRAFCSLVRLEAQSAAADEDVTA